MAYDALQNTRQNFKCKPHSISSAGGLDTLDELLEVMTLVQTGKHPAIPIVMLGKRYWDKVSCACHLITVSK